MAALRFLFPPNRVFLAIELRVIGVDPPKTSMTSSSLHPLFAMAPLLVLPSAKTKATVLFDVAVVTAAWAARMLLNVAVATAA